jgi:LuxR family maltose regulon positive regulatory protein
MKVNETGTAGSVPVRNFIMERPRVDTIISRALQKSVTLVYGGEGCGKSYAVYSYLQNISARIWWIQLSEADNNPSRFWETVCNAITQYDAASASVVAGIGFPGTGERFKLSYDNILDLLKPNLSYVLVFDDVHLISNGEVKSFLVALAENPLPGVSHIFISRIATIPTYDLGMSDSDFMIIDESDLLFTKVEVAEYLASFDIDASAELVETVHSASEGLAYLVNLAGKIAGKLTDPTLDMRSAIKRSVSKLVDDQFFAESPEEIKKFYVKLSLLDHLTRDLVYSIPDGEELMADAMRRTSMIRYDTYMHTYHLHHLFIEFLRTKKDLLTEEEERATYEAAAEWCAKHHYEIEAMGYYEKLRDYAAIIDIARTMHIYVDFHAGEYLLGILENADPSVFEENPEARVLYARVLLSLGMVDESIEKTEDFIAELTPLRKTRPVVVALLWLHNNLGFAKILKSTDTAECDFAQYFRKADEYMNEPCMAAWEPPLINATIVTYACLMGNNAKGEPERYIAEIERCIPHTVRTMGGCLYGSDDLGRSELAYYRGDMAACERYAVQSYLKAKEKSQSYIASRALFLLLRMNITRGRYGKVKEVLTHYEELVKASDAYTEYVQQDIVLGWYYASIGEVENIAPWIKSAFMSSDREAYVTGLEDIAKLKYYFSEKKYQVMLAFLDRRPMSYGIRKFLIGQIGMAVCEAVCLYNLKDRKGAFEAIRRAYKLSAPNAFDMPYIEMGNHMRSLGGAMLKEDDPGVPRKWLELVRSKAATYAKRVAHVKSEYRRDVGKDGNIQLTLKEKEVLQDVSQGLSRTEIAAYRGISVNTVKAMLQIIYEKLGADNSMDALRIAISRDLI